MCLYFLNLEVNQFFKTESIHVEKSYILKMSDTQRLIFSIIEFLNSEIQSSSVSEDERESLEGRIVTNLQ